MKVQTAEEKLWAKRLQISEVSRSTHRSNASTLVAENSRLQTDLQAAERDAVEVITHFNQQLAKKEQENLALEESLKEQKRQSQEDQAELKRSFAAKYSKLEEELVEKDRQLAKAKNEIEGLHNWSEMRHDMRSELDLLKADNESAKRKYDEFMEQTEEKFTQARIRWQQEKEAEIERLASNAQDVAIDGLDKATRSVYADNVRLSEELAINKAENERLAALSKKTQLLCDDLNSKTEESQKLARHSVTKARDQNKLVEELKAKVASLEAALSNVIRDFDDERARLIERADGLTMETRADLGAATRALTLKTAENKRIRHLARYVVEQRSELEVFFHEALDEIRAEIARSRQLYEKSLKAEHRRRMVEGQKSGVLPPIKASSAVHAEFDEARNLQELADGVDIRDLTWEQKETVLRRLFAKLNTAKKLPSSNGKQNISSSRGTDSHSPQSAWKSATLEQTQNEVDESGGGSFFITDPEVA